MSTVQDIFNDIQKSSQCHKLCMKKLLSLISNTKAKTNDVTSVENVTLFLNGGIDRILLHPGTANNIQRSINFLGLFLSTVDEKLLLTTMNHLCSRLKSSNKLVRQRVCHIICSSLEGLSDAKIELSCDLFTQLSQHIVIRLKDKVPTVRVWAVKALKFLQVPEDEDDLCTNELKRCMKSDTSASVRVATVETLVITENSKNELFARLKDVHSDVRIALLTRLTNETDIRQFTVQMRAEILRSALEDREESVRLTVLSLIWKWLSNVDNGNIPKFLSLLNPSENEDAALLVGVTIMEELTKRESVQDSKLKKSIKDNFGTWKNVSTATLTPSDILWVYIRCSYARHFLPVLPASEICDVLLPDAVVLCTLIAEFKATLIDPTNHHTKASSIKKTQFIVKYIMNLFPLLIGTTDVSGLTQLMTECADSFLNTSVVLSWDCIESALRSYSELYEVATNSVNKVASHYAVLGMTIHLREEATKTMQQQQAAVEDTQEEEDIEESTNNATSSVMDSLLQRHVLSITERCLQITQWGLQQELSLTASTSSIITTTEVLKTTKSDILKQVLPYVLDALQQPETKIRYLGVSCLGLLCLVDINYCELYRGIILQVASCGDFEDESIRGQALQALADFATIHRGKYINDNDVTNLLLRMQEGGEPESMLVAAETAAKMLHAGLTIEPRLFGNLLKFFFLTESIPSITSNTTTSNDKIGDEMDEEAIEQEYQQRIFLANCSRMQQVLSIFFHVFTTTNDVVPTVITEDTDIVSESIPQLVSDMTNEIKDGTVDVHALAKILKHLFSLCENKTSAPIPVSTVPVIVEQTNTTDTDEAVSEDIVVNNDVTSTSSTLLNTNKPTMLSLVEATTLASLSKELLKLGNSKIEKSIDKEYIKIISTLNMEAWISHFNIDIMIRVIDTITVCNVHDKTSMKYLEQLMNICMNVKNNHSPILSKVLDFIQLAPGLTDMIELAARSSVLDTPVHKKKAIKTLRSNPKSASIKYHESDDNDSSDDDDDDCVTEDDSNMDVGTPSSIHTTTTTSSSTFLIDDTTLFISPTKQFVLATGTTSRISLTRTSKNDANLKITKQLQHISCDENDDPTTNIMIE